MLFGKYVHNDSGCCLKSEMSGCLSLAIVKNMTNMFPSLLSTQGP